MDQFCCSITTLGYSILGYNHRKKWDYCMHCGLVILGYSKHRKSYSSLWSLSCVSFIFWLEKHLLSGYWLYYIVRKISTNLKYSRYTTPSAFIMNFFFSAPSLTVIRQTRSRFESSASLQLPYLKLSAFNILPLTGCSVLVLSSMCSNLDFWQRWLFNKHMA